MTSFKIFRILFVQTLPANLILLLRLHSFRIIFTGNSNDDYDDVGNDGNTNEDGAGPYSDQESETQSAYSEHNSDSSEHIPDQIEQMSDVYSNTDQLRTNLISEIGKLKSNFIFNYFIFGELPILDYIYLLLISQLIFNVLLLPKNTYLSIYRTYFLLGRFVRPPLAKKRKTTSSRDNTQSQLSNATSKHGQTNRLVNL